jgi:hypothetical protein
MNRISAEDIDRTRRRRGQAEEEFDRRRLAGAVWAKQGHEFPCAYREVHVAQGLDLAVAFADATQSGDRVSVAVRSQQWNLL